MHIVLTGFMAAGKTAVGRKLARRLGREFLDTDRLVEKAAGCSIPEIFARDGEKEFRRLEQEMDEMLGRWAWPLGIRSAARGTFPPMNIGVTPDQVEVYFFAPGLDPKSIDVSVQQNVLTIAGERASPAVSRATPRRRVRGSASPTSTPAGRGASPRRRAARSSIRPTS